MSSDCNFPLGTGFFVLQGKQFFLYLCLLLGLLNPEDRGSMFSKPLVKFYHTTKYYIPEYSIFHDEVIFTSQKDKLFFII
jgi:hypothetical protein